MVRELKCPYGDDFEGGDECDRCEQYELCMETYPPLNLIEIPKGATNGDVFKLVFSNAERKHDVTFGGWMEANWIECDGEDITHDEWWNAPYKSDCIPSEYDLSEDIELSNPQMYR